MPDLSQKLAAAEARARALERRRTEADCRFAGRYAEMSGSHCPIGDPCQRCQLEAAEARVAELEGWVADEVLWLQSSATFGPLDRLARIQALLAPPPPPAPERKEEKRG